MAQAALQRWRCWRASAPSFSAGRRIDDPRAVEHFRRHPLQHGGRATYFSQPERAMRALLSGYVVGSNRGRRLFHLTRFRILVFVGAAEILLESLLFDFAL